MPNNIQTLTSCEGIKIYLLWRVYGINLEWPTNRLHSGANVFIVVEFVTSILRVTMTGSSKEIAQWPSRHCERYKIKYRDKVFFLILFSIFIYILLLWFLFDLETKLQL